MMTMERDDRLLTIAEAASVAGVSEWTIHSHRQFGELVAIFDGRRYYIYESEVRRFIAARAENAEIRKARIERRRREKAERYERWLKQQGLMRIQQCVEDGIKRLIDVIESNSQPTPIRIAAASLLLDRAGEETRRLKTRR